MACSSGRSGGCTSSKRSATSLKLAMHERLYIYVAFSKRGSDFASLLSVPSEPDLPIYIKKMENLLELLFLGSSSSSSSSTGLKSYRSVDGLAAFGLELLGHRHFFDRSPWWKMPPCVGRGLLTQLSRAQSRKKKRRFLLAIIMNWPSLDLRRNFNPMPRVS